MRKRNFLSAGNKNFVKYQAQGGVNPNPHCFRPWSRYKTRFGANAECTHVVNQAQRRISK